MAPDQDRKNEIQKPAETESPELDQDGMKEVVGGITMSQPKLTQSPGGSSPIAKITIIPCV